MTRCTTTSERMSRALESTGWIRRGLMLADEMADSIEALCGDMHQSREPCGFCRPARQFKAAARRASKQLAAIELERLRRAHSAGRGLTALHPKV